MPSFVMKPRFPALQLACNLGRLLTPTSASASAPLDPTQETPRAPLGTRAGAGVPPGSLGQVGRDCSVRRLSPGSGPSRAAGRGPWERPPSTSPGPWGRGRGWGQGQKAQAEDGPPRDGAHRDGPCQQGEAGSLSTPSKEEPAPARMRPRPGQGAREAPRGQRGVPRQPWPLILLGLASHPVGAHGLLPPTAVPRNPAPRMEAPSGKSPWSLWGR